MTKHWTLYRRSSFSDPFNASHDSGFMMDPSLFAIPAVDDRRLSRWVPSKSWGFVLRSSKQWKRMIGCCQLLYSRRPDPETGGDRRRPDFGKVMKNVTEEPDGTSIWNIIIVCIYIYTVYIYIYIYILHIYGYSTIGHTSHILHRLVTFSLNDTHTHMHALRVDGQIFTIGGFAESLNLRQTIRVPLWSHDVSWELPLQSDVAPGSPADPRWRSPVSTRLGALWNVVHSTMLGRFTVKLPSGYLT